MKTSLPIFGTRKEHFSSYLAEFMCRYKHKDSDPFKVFLGIRKRYTRLTEQSPELITLM